MIVPDIATYTREESLVFRERFTSNGTSSNFSGTITCVMRRSATTSHGSGVAADCGVAAAREWHRLARRSEQGCSLPQRSLRVGPPRSDVKNCPSALYQF
jgi:hypothetical protein